MLKRILSIVALAFTTMVSSQAQTVQDIFGNTTKYAVTWYGIDYTHVKIVGPLATFGGTTTVTPADLSERYYADWNYLILDEPEKFDIAKMIKHKTVEKDISMVKKINAAAKTDSVEVKITPYYTPQEIQGFVSSYSTTDTTGIGLIFIAESMNKIKAEAYYHVVFFNLATKEILLQERFRGVASGMNVRNYWAGSYFSVMEYIREDAYSKWQKKYAPNAQTQSAPKW